MAQCMESLRRTIKGFKAGTIGQEDFRDQTFEIIMGGMDQSFSKEEVEIILGLMEQMKSMGIADPATCDEVAEHFRDKVNAADSGQDADAAAEPSPHRPETAAGPRPVAGPGHARAPLTVGEMSAVQRQVNRLRAMPWWFLALVLIWVLLGIGGSVLFLGQYASLLMVPVTWAVLVCGLLIIFSNWHYLHQETGAISPVWSVVLLMLPVVNLIALIPVVHGQAVVMREAFVRRGLSGRGPNTGLSLWTCIITLITTVPSLVLFGLVVLGVDSATDWVNSLDLEEFIYLAIAYVALMVVSAMAVVVLSIILFFNLNGAMAALVQAEENPVPPRYLHFILVVVGMFIVSFGLTGLFVVFMESRLYF